MYRKSCFLQDNQYTSREQRIVSPTFLVVSIHQTSPIYSNLYFVYDYQCTSKHSYCRSHRWFNAQWHCELNPPPVNAIEKTSQNNKKLNFCIYFNFISLFLANLIQKMIIKKKKKSDSYSAKYKNRRRIIISCEDFRG